MEEYNKNLVALTKLMDKFDGKMVHFQCWKRATLMHICSNPFSKNVSEPILGQPRPSLLEASSGHEDALLDADETLPGVHAETSPATMKEQLHIKRYRAQGLDETLTRQWELLRG